MRRTIGDICNYYGCLEVKEEGGKFYWNIENWDGDYWQEIPKYLYDALNQFEDESIKANQEEA